MTRGAPRAAGSKEARRAGLGRAIEQSGAQVSRPAFDALLTWLEGIVEWNARIDLTAARSDDELVDLMVADALVLSARLPRGATFVDVGTGAGAPGLGLALLRPDLAATLVEPLDKRVAFLRRTIGALPWGDGARPAVARGRADALVAEGRTFDVALSRATLPPPEWLAVGADLAPQGSVWVLLAQGDPPDLAGLSAVEDVVYTWPLTGVSRRALRYSRGG